MKEGKLVRLVKTKSNPASMQSNSNLSPNFLLCTYDNAPRTHCAFSTDTANATFRFTGDWGKKKTLIEFQCTKENAGRHARRVL